MSSTNPLDHLISQALVKTAAPISRRSAVGTGLKVLFGVSGLGVNGYLFSRYAGTGRKVRRMTAQAIVPLNSVLGNCAGLHGYLCTGNCSTSAAGASGCVKSDTTKAGSSWVACCNTKPAGEAKSFQCYQMLDWVCTTRGTNWGTGCDGAAPSGTVWFGGTQGTKVYTCTEMDSNGTTYTSGTTCATNCTQTQYPNSGGVC